MSRRTGLALFLAMAVLFLIANRGAYKGYFQDDEFDNLSWAPHVPLADYAKALVTPQFLPGNFRPAGHAYFALLGPRFGLHFPPYVLPLHLLHFLNVWLLWMLARRLGASPLGATAAALFFSFHMAAFDVYWKPMYVFDLLCGTFCLASLLFWTRGNWVLSFVSFWLAYKSKELAVMLPAVLACYEYWLGKRRWKPLIPFFLVSLSFGLQAMLQTRHEQTDYAFRFRPWAVKETGLFYASRLAMFPYGGLLLLLVPAVFRDRRVWFGTAAMLLFFFPLAFLPGRMFAAYCYVPLIGLAVALSWIAERHRLAVAVFFLVWIPFNYLHLKLNRRQALAIADENRRYVTALAEYLRSSPETRQFVYDGRPFNFHPWGIEGAIKCLSGKSDVMVAGVEDRQAHEALRGGAPVAVLSWDTRGRLTVASRKPGAPDASYIRMDRATPIWQLDDGWFQFEGGFRWTRARATAHLYRPAGAHAFELTVNMGPEQIRLMKQTEVRVFLNGESAGSRMFSRNGWQTVRWDVAPAPASSVEVRFESDPFLPSKDPRALGVAVVAFGFVE